MREGWNEVKISELCIDIVDCLNRTAPKVDYETGYKMIRTSNVRNGRIDLTDCFFVSEEIFKKWNRRLTPLKGDIILTREAPLGEVGILNNDDKVFLGQRTVLYRANEKHCNNKFLYYSLLAPFCQSKIKSFGSGSTVEHMRVPDSKEIPVVVPPLEIQNKIASILSGYDDLIENNLKRIKILEEMAQQTYEEWFVRMRFPGYETAEINAETGLPVGWQVELVGKQLAKIKSTLKIKSSDIQKKGAIPVIDQSRDFIAGFTDEPSSIIKYENTPFLVFGDHTRILKLINFDFARGADGTQIIVSNNESMPQHLFYFAMRNIDLSNYHYARHFKYLKDSEIIIPTKEMAHKFEVKASEIYATIRNLQNQNQRLREARDILLPRLMMGMVEV